MIWLLFILLLLIGGGDVRAQGLFTAPGNMPGPSLALFNSPPYTCTTNFYASPTGLAGNTGTIGSPWDIVTAFTTNSYTAGTCVNIADGSYTLCATGLDIGGGSNTTTGSSATPSGYVVYRAYQTMDGPHITLCGTATGNMMVVDANAKYIWIDGLNIDGQVSTSHKTQNCIQATGNSTGNLGDGRSSHHVYITNSIIQGCGQAGIQGSNTDYEFVIHSTVYNNAWNPAFVLASGISIYEPLALQGYTATNCASNPPDCSTNKAMAYDSYWCATGSSHAALNVCYSLVVAFNWVYGNYNPQVSGNTGNTDGEGYESDDWAHVQNSCTGLTPGCPFNHNGLVLGNAFYGNGSGGYEINGNCGPTTLLPRATPGAVLVMNNTAAYNGWDPQNGASEFGDFLAFGDMVNVFWINNVAISNNYNHPIFGCSTCNFGIDVDQNNGGCGPPSCANSGTLFETNVVNNVNIQNSSLTYPTVGTNHNQLANPLLINAAPVTVNTNAAPTLNARNLALSGSSPAIAFGQAISLWPQSANIDVGACIHGLASCP